MASSRPTVALFLAGVVLLAACRTKKAAAPSVASASVAATAAPTTVAPTTSAPPVSTTRARPGPSLPSPACPSPTPSKLNRPALVVKIDNLDPDARPQTGLTTADVCFEEQVEGGITRFACIWQSRRHRRRRAGPVDPNHRRGHRVGARSAAVRLLGRQRRLPRRHPGRADRRRGRRRPAGCLLPVRSEAGAPQPLHQGHHPLLLRAGGAHGRRRCARSRPAGPPSPRPGRRRHPRRHEVPRRRRSDRHLGLGRRPPRSGSEGRTAPPTSPTDGGQIRAANVIFEYVRLPHRRLSDRQGNRPVPSRWPS